MDPEAPPRGRSPFRRWLPVLVFALIAVVAVWRFNRPESSGEIDPVVSASFPANVESGAVETARVTVRNSSASDIANLFVSFSQLGTAGGADLPTPIVGGITSHGGSPVLSIDPKPSASGGGVRFGFGELPAGEELEVEFELRMPEQTGPAANSIVVYDGSVPDRAGGTKIETIVES